MLWKLCGVEDLEELGLPGPPAGPLDPQQVQARERVSEWFRENESAVAFSRQLEVIFEHEFYHWITYRAIGDLVQQGILRTEPRRLVTGSPLYLLRHRRNRYYRRTARRVLGLVNEYAAPNIGASLGLHGEAMILEGFAAHRFVMQGRETRQHAGRTWQQTDHDLDFIFERDGMAYGVEVKNTLGYMDYKELALKIRMCRHLRIRPVFVCRMLPKTWSWEVIQSGGFALILKWQLYPWTHKDLARRVQRELRLPVDSPRRLQQGTMERFVRWHQRQKSMV